MADVTNVEQSSDKIGKRNNKIIEVLALIVVLGGVIWIGTLFFDFSGSIATNNAQVDADITEVTARVSGFVKEVRFDAYSLVQEGDTLVLLDDEEFRIKLDQAEADLAIAKVSLLAAEQSVITATSNQESSSAKLKGNEANLEKAEKNYTRFENMFADSAVTRNQFDQVIAQLKSDQAFLEASKKDILADKSTTKQNLISIESAKATVNRKSADLNAAKLQFSYTVIIASVSGIIGEKTIEKGELVNSNQIVANIVQQNKKWVTANFKETQLEEISVGQRATIEVDALNGKKFEGKVKDLSPATGAKFSMVAPDNSTGNFVKITQRIPVRIEFTGTPEELKEIKPGMNVSVDVIK